MKKDDIIAILVEKERLLELVEKKVESLAAEKSDVSTKRAEEKKEYSKTELENAQLRKVIKDYEKQTELLRNIANEYVKGYNQCKYANNAIIKNIQGLSDLASELHLVTEDIFNEKLQKINRGDE